MTSVRRVGMLLAGFLLFALPSFSQQLYISNESQELLEVLNLSTGTFTTLYNVTGLGTGSKPDDLILNSQGQLLYSVGGGTGAVNLYDPVAKVNSTLVSDVPYARDLVIEPGGLTMLIALYTPGSIVRYNFATGVKTTLIKKLVTCDGIAYDPNGNLYAVADHNTIIQINPVTGAILNTLVLEPHKGVNGGDGLTYDSYTGSLWATHDGTTGSGLLEIPITKTGLAGTFTFFPTSAQGVNAPDGIKSDGLGNLYIGAIWTTAVYNIPTGKVTKNIVTKGADGVSLVPGTY
jgi:hypothetical protein